ncbi:MAG: tetratricopeptide repeat protein [Alphaproteobacteria bacterium]|nr:tetratricopeptide repeat protein [Alphaproteobacteria bacterium]
MNREPATPLERALKKSPGLPEVLGAVGATLAGLGRFSEAIAKYETALVIDANNVTMLNNLASFFLRGGDP